MLSGTSPEQRGDYDTPSPPAQVLCGGEIGMAGAGDVPRRSLGYGRDSKKEQKAEDTSEDAIF